MKTAWFKLPTKQNAPKFERVVLGITDALHNKELKRGQLLPSISQVSERYDLARETVAKAYRVLKSRGIIHSVPSKGYYVSTETSNHAIRIFLLLSTINQNNKQIYETLREELGDRAVINVFFHNFNAEVFNQLILDNLDQYGMFLIKPFTHSKPLASLSKVPAERLILIDRQDHLNKERTFVGQNFDSAVDDCLETNKAAFKKYKKKINLIYSDTSHHPAEIKNGFTHFCRRNDFQFSMKPGNKFKKVSKGEIYFVVTDGDLGKVLSSCEEQGIIIGKDVGIVSYNDSALKKFIAGGLTVLSTDFKQMGKKAAGCILDNKQDQIVIPTKMILRNSL